MWAWHLVQLALISVSHCWAKFMYWCVSSKYVCLVRFYMNWDGKNGLHVMTKHVAPWWKTVCCCVNIMEYVTVWHVRTLPLKKWTVKEPLINMNWVLHSYFVCALHSPPFVKPKQSIVTLHWPKHGINLCFVSFCWKVFTQAPCVPLVIKHQANIYGEL